MMKSTTPFFQLALWCRLIVCRFVPALGAVAVTLLIGNSAFATPGTQNSFFQNSSMATAANYSSAAAPTNVQDILLTTSSTALTLTAATRNFGSLNATNGLVYTISDGTTGTTNSVINLGGGTTNGITGASGSDLIFLSGNSSLTLQGPNSSTGSGVLGVALAANGNFDASSGSTLSISGVVSGAFALGVNGAGTVNFSGTGANTYSGLTTVSHGTLNLNKTGAVAIAGNLTVAGGTVALQQSNQIASAKATTVSSGTLALGANSNSLTNVSLTGGSITSTTGVLTGLTNAFDVQSGNASAVLAGSVGLVKTTSGTVTLSGANTYFGGTTVSAGTLSVTGNGRLGNTSGTVSVGGGGTLSIGSGVTLGNTINVTGALNGSGLTSVFSGTVSGNGTLGGTMKITGALAPGNSPGIINVAANGSLTFGSGSTYSWDLGSLTDNLTGTAGTDFDQIKLLTSTSALNATLGTLVPSFGSTPAPNSGNVFWNSAHTWTVVDNTAGGTITGTFLATNLWSGSGTFSLGATTLNWIPATTAIPEPSTGAALLGLAAIASAMAWRRQRLR